MSKTKKIVFLVIFLLLIVVVSGYYADKKKSEIELKYQSDQEVFKEMIEHRFN